MIFAKILSSNQVLWDSFSPLEKNRHLNKDGTDENKQVKIHHQQSNNNKKYLLSFCSEDGSFVLELQLRIRDHNELQI